MAGANQTLFTIEAIDVATYPMRTRMPFRFGIAVMTALPHMIVRLRLRLASGESAEGYSAEGLLPKWFEKNPDTTADEDLERMWAAVRFAGLAALHGGSAASAFGWWRELAEVQRNDLGANGYPPLLWNFGVSVIERAVIDGLCRAWRTTFSAALRDGRFGVDPRAINPEVGGAAEAAVRMAEPRSFVHLRHTVGMSDPLSPADVREPIADGLPECLGDDIRTYGLTHFKIKVANRFDEDRARLADVFGVIEQGAAPTWAFTLDGNEQFHEVDEFRDYWGRLLADPAFAPRVGRLLFVEQPVARSVALSEASRAALVGWADRPPMIIDESDGDVDALPLAVAGGYVGTSHKNCKGVFKGVVNRMLIEQRRHDDPATPWTMSGEDLVNIGPIALLQDLAAMAKLDIAHVERNGHHYFRGLSMFPDEVGSAVVADHPGLYGRHRDGFVELQAADGRLALDSVNQAPFGSGRLADLFAFQPIADWDAPRAP